MLQYWKQFLYVSLLMVLMGPFRDPFFLPDNFAFQKISERNEGVFWVT